MFVPDNYIRRTSSTIPFGYELDADFEGYLKPIQEDLKILQYQLPKSFDNFTSIEKKLYEIGFKNGLRFLNKAVYKKLKFRVPKHNLGRIKEEELQQLIQKVCDRYEVSKKELLSKCRRRDIVRSRNILHNVLN